MFHWKYYFLVFYASFDQDEKHKKYLSIPNFYEVATWNYFAGHQILFYLYNKKQGDSFKKYTQHCNQRFNE